MTVSYSLVRSAGLLALSLCVVAVELLAQPTPPSPRSPVQYANGLVGTAPLDQQKLIGNAPPPGEQLYSGFTSPAAMLPHSSTQVGPINANLDLMYPAGVRASYFYPNRSLFGFTSGAEGSPTVMPVVGDWTVPPERSSSVYDKTREVSSPGYYSVYLQDFQTKAEMTATTWTGLFRFTFPKTDKAHVILDLGDSGGDIEIPDNRTVRGKVRGRDMFFVAEFSQPFALSGTFQQHPSNHPGWPILGDSEVDPGSANISGRFAGAYVSFSTRAGEQILVKVATGRSYAMAEARLQSEDPGWDFDNVRRRAEQAWAQKLNLIQVTGGTEKQKMLFYSCLYHSFYSPQLLAHKGEPFIGEDHKVHTATFDRYDQVPLWDTGRNQVVLLTMLEPEVKVDILRSQVDIASETGYMGTSFHGDHADLMFLGDWLRGLNFDWASAWPYLLKNATDPDGPRPFLAEYMRNGWISDIIPDRNPSPPYAGGKAGAATTLEYSWDDHALALYAQKLGHQDDYEMLMKRANNYRNVFDPAVGFMRGRTSDGKWISPFDPREPYYNFMMKEASGWSTLWLVPHDVQGLINLLGGREKFAAKLDQFFDTPYTAKGICRDCTGVIDNMCRAINPTNRQRITTTGPGSHGKHRS